MNNLKVAIVDYQLGNLFSVANACEKFGIKAEITSSRNEILAADGLILPGVGAFGDAMENLTRLQLIEPIKEVAQRGTPTLGICLGMQLMMTESFEFGHHPGLNLIPGKVIHFSENRTNTKYTLKIPEVQWNKIRKTDLNNHDLWANTLLDGIQNNEYMYFVHSYYCVPQESEKILSLTRYGEIEYCSTVAEKNIFACQYHPEKSGVEGLKIYKNFASLIQERNSHG